MQWFGSRLGALLVLFLSVSYWVYLAAASEMEIKFDAEVYEKLGRMIHEKGWVEYFKTGPNREPLYLFLVSTAMQLGDLWSVPYQYIMKLIHIAILFATQLMTYLLMGRLGIKHWTKLGVILYLGFSPAIVNSALSLWSEIATYPLVLGIIFSSAISWRELLRGRSKKALVSGIVLAGFFVLMTLTKAIFECVVPFLLGPFLGLAFWAGVRRRTSLMVQALGFVLLVGMIFSGYAFLHRTANQRYNGHFSLTDRGPHVFYANATRRTQKLNPRLFMAAVAMVPGDGVSRGLFGENDFFFWSPQAQDARGGLQVMKLRQEGVPETEFDSQLIRLGVQAVLSNPLQFGLLTFMEGFKMIFWESTKIGYVRYPNWLARLYDFSPFKNVLRLFVSLLTLVALMSTLDFVRQHRQKILDGHSGGSESIQILLFILLLIFTYIGTYSLTAILTRYAFPIVPLYLLAIGYSIERFFGNRHLLFFKTRRADRAVPGNRAADRGFSNWRRNLRT
jgi:hypothetical protein